MTRIQIYTTKWCGYCTRAKALLERLGHRYEEVDLGDDPSFRSRLMDETGGFTVPQIVVDGRPIGGFDQLLAADRSGRLPELLAA